MLRHPLVRSVRGLKGINVIKNPYRLPSAFGSVVGVVSKHRLQRYGCAESIMSQIAEKAINRATKHNQLDPLRVFGPQGMLR